MLRRRCRRNRQFNVEVLEQRQLLTYSLNGGAWTHPERITYSFMPDGTSIGGISSNANAAMPSSFGSPIWQNEVIKAAASWEDSANINLVQVSDNGSALGVSGNQQSDSRFGDIRIGGYNIGGSVLGEAMSPPPYNGGTNAGDIFFNTAQSWQTNGTTYDVRSVASHEFGHALGMGHSTSTSSVMYPTYTTNQSLITEDVSGIQAIYGARPADSFEGALNNNSSTRSTDLTPYLDGSGYLNQRANINSSVDVDWYKITLPAGSTGMGVYMQSQYLSMLVPNVNLYKSIGGVMTLQSSQIGTLQGSGTYAYAFASGSPGDVIYIKDLAGTTGPGKMGDYAIDLFTITSPVGFLGAPNTTVASQADSGGGTQLEVIEPLTHPIGPDNFFRKHKG